MASKFNLQEEADLFTIACSRGANFNGEYGDKDTLSRLKHGIREVEAALTRIKSVVYFVEH